MKDLFDFSTSLYHNNNGINNLATYNPTGEAVANSYLTELQGIEDYLNNFSYNAKGISNPVAPETSGIVDSFINNLPNADFDVNLNTAENKLFGYDPSKQTADKRLINSFEEASVGIATSMWRDLRNSMNELSKMTIMGDYAYESGVLGLYGLFNKEGVSINSQYKQYETEVLKAEKDFQSGLESPESYEKRKADLAIKYADVLEKRKEMFDEISEYDELIESRKINKKYSLTADLLEGESVGLLDKIQYQLPRLIGSSAGLMIPQILATFGSGFVAGGATSAASGIGIPAAPVVGTITGTLASLATLLHFRKQETLAEIGGQYMENLQVLTDNYMRENGLSDPSQIPMEDKIKIDNQATKGFQDLFIGNMALAAGDILQALILPGSQFLKTAKGISATNAVINPTLNVASKTPSLISKLGQTINTTKGSILNGLESSKFYNTALNPITRIGGKVWGTMLTEGFEEGFQYALNKRAGEIAQNDLDGNNISLLDEAFEVSKSLNINPLSVVSEIFTGNAFGKMTLGGKYSEDDEFQFSASGGMLLAGIMGLPGAAINSISSIKGLSKYTSELEKLGAISTIKEKNEIMVKNLSQALISGRTNELKIALRGLSSKFENGELENFLSPEESKNYIDYIDKTQAKYDLYKNKLDNLPKDSLLGMRASGKLKEAKQGLIFDLLTMDNQLEEMRKNSSDLDSTINEKVDTLIKGLNNPEVLEFSEQIKDLWRTMVKSETVKSIFENKEKFSEQLGEGVNKYFTSDFEQYVKEINNDFKGENSYEYKFNKLVEDITNKFTDVETGKTNIPFDIETLMQFDEEFIELGNEHTINEVFEYNITNNFKRASELKTPQDIINYHNQKSEVISKKLEEESEKLKEKEKSKTSEEIKKEEEKKTTTSDEDDVATGSDLNDFLENRNSTLNDFYDMFDTVEDPTVYKDYNFDNLEKSLLDDYSEDLKRDLTEKEIQKIKKIVEAIKREVFEKIKHYNPETELPNYQSLSSSETQGGQEEGIEIKDTIYEPNVPQDNYGIKTPSKDSAEFTTIGNTSLLEKMNGLKSQVKVWLQGNKNLKATTDGEINEISNSKNGQRVLMQFLKETGVLKPNSPVIVERVKNKTKAKHPYSLVVKFADPNYPALKNHVIGYMADLASDEKNNRLKKNVDKKDLDFIKSLHEQFENNNNEPLITSLESILPTITYTEYEEVDGTRNLVFRPISEVFKLDYLASSEEEKIDKRIHFTVIKDPLNSGKDAFSFIPSEILKDKNGIEREIIFKPGNKEKGSIVALIPKIENGKEVYLAVTLNRRNISEFEEQFSQAEDKKETVYGEMMINMMRALKSTKNSSKALSVLKNFTRVRENSVDLTKGDSIESLIDKVASIDEVGLHYFNVINGKDENNSFFKLVYKEGDNLVRRYFNYTKVKDSEGNTKELIVSGDNIIYKNGFKVNDNVLANPSSSAIVTEINDSYNFSIPSIPLAPSIEVFKEIGNLRTDIDVNNLNFFYGESDKSAYNSIRNKTINYGLFTTFLNRMNYNERFKDDKGNLPNDEIYNTRDGKFLNDISLTNNDGTVLGQMLNSLNKDEYEHLKFQYFGNTYGNIVLSGDINNYKPINKQNVEAIINNKTEEIPFVTDDEGNVFTTRRSRKSTSKEVKNTNIDDSVQVELKSQLLTHLKSDDSLTEDKQNYVINREIYERVTKVVNSQMEFTSPLHALKVSNQSLIGNFNDIYARELFKSVKVENGQVVIENKKSFLSSIHNIIKSEIGEDKMNQIFPKDRMDAENLYKGTFKSFEKIISEFNKVVSSTEFINQYGEINGVISDEILLRTVGTTRKVAGTSDILFTTNKNMVIVGDFKTNYDVESEIPKFERQLSAYRVLLESMGYQVADKGFIFHTYYNRSNTEALQNLSEASTIDNFTIEELSNGYSTDNSSTLLNTYGPTLIGVNDGRSRFLVELDLSYDTNFENELKFGENKNTQKVNTEEVIPEKILSETETQEEDSNIINSSKEQEVKNEAEDNFFNLLNGTGNLVNLVSQEENNNTSDIINSIDITYMNEFIVKHGVELMFNKSTHGKAVSIDEAFDYSFELLKTHRDTLQKNVDSTASMKLNEYQTKLINSFKNNLKKLNYVLEQNEKGSYINSNILRKEFKKYVQLNNLSLSEDSQYDDTNTTEKSFVDDSLKLDFFKELDGNVKLLMSYVPQYTMNNGNWVKGVNPFGLTKLNNAITIYSALKSLIDKKFDSTTEGLEEMLNQFRNSSNQNVLEFVKLIDEVGVIKNDKSEIVNNILNSKLKHLFFTKFATYTADAILSIDDLTNSKDGTIYQGKVKDATELSKLTSAKNRLVSLMESNINIIPVYQIVDNNLIIEEVQKGEDSPYRLVKETVNQDSFTTTIFDKAMIKRLISNYKKVNKYYNDNSKLIKADEDLTDEEKSEAYNNLLTEVKSHYKSIFDLLGLNISPEGFEKILNGVRIKNTKLSPFQELQKRFEDSIISVLDAVDKETKDKFVSPRKVVENLASGKFNKIAKAVVSELDNLESGSVSIGDSTKSPFIRHSFITGIQSTIKEAFDKKDPSLLDKIYMGSFSENSFFKEQILQAIANDDESLLPTIHFNFGNTVEGTNEYVETNDFESVDFLRNSILKHQNSGAKAYHFYDTLSDKSVMILVSFNRQIVSPEVFSKNEDGYFNFNSENLNVFYGYFQNEFNSIKKVIQENNKLSKQEKIENYHSNILKETDNSFRVGLGDKFVLLPELNAENLSIREDKDSLDLLSKLYTKENGLYTLNVDFDFNSQKNRELVEKAISRGISKSSLKYRKTLENNGIVVKEVELNNKKEEVPVFNKNISVLFSKDYVGKISGKTGEVIPVLNNDSIKSLIARFYKTEDVKIEKQLNKEIDSFLKSLNVNEISNEEARDVLIDYVITDFVYNYQIKSIEELMLTGNPAFGAKKTELKNTDEEKNLDKYLSDDRYKQKVLQKSLKNMADNISKRNASLMAAGNLGVWDSKIYRSSIANDISIQSQHLEEYVEVLNNRLGRNKVEKAYDSSDVADAQELITVKEALDQLLAYGKIDKEEHKGALYLYDVENYNEVYGKEKPLSREIEKGEKVIFPVEKPVQRMSLKNDNIDNPLQVYFKSSAYILFPEFVKNTPFENVLKGMKENNVSRLIFKSGVKLNTHPAKDLFIKIDNDNYEFNKDFFEGNIYELDRNNYYLQLEVPYKANKSKVTTSSQQKRMFILNFPNHVKMVYRGDGSLYNDKNELNYKTAFELKKIFYNSYAEIFNAELDKLKKEIGVDENGVIKNPQKLSKLLAKEAQSRNYNPNAIKGLRLIKGENGKKEFEVPLGFSLNSKEIEPVITSIIEKRIALSKMPGFSMVQGSEVILSGETGNTKGKKGKFVSDENMLSVINEAKKYGGIIYAKEEYVGLTKLQHNRKSIEKGKKDYVERMQVITTQYLNNGSHKIDLLEQDSNGNYIYVDNNLAKQGKFVLNDRIDPSILEANGFRIPYQGFNSGNAIEIVGFLPKQMGDLMIVPGEIAGQMGSDYDVDKIYGYNYNYYIEVDKTGKPRIKPVTSKTTLNDVNNTKLILINKIKNEFSLSDSQLYRLFPEMNPSITDLTSDQLKVELMDLSKGESKLRKDIIKELKIKPDSLKIYTDDDLNIMKNQNKIIAVHIATYTSMFNYENVLSPNSMHIIEKTIEDFNTLKEVNPTGQEEYEYLGIQDPTAQFELYYSNKSGKFGVAISSLASTGHAISQLANLYLNDLTINIVDNKGEIITDSKHNELDPNRNDLYDVSSETKGLWRLDKVDTIEAFTFYKKNKDGSVEQVNTPISLLTYKISDVINHIQSMSVDNAKEQLLALYGLNDQNFNLGMTIVRMGVHPYHLKLFLEQPVIKEFYKKIATTNSMYQEEIIADKFNTIIEDLTSSLYKKIKSLNSLPYENLENLDFKILEEAIAENRTLNSNNIEFLNSQLIVLNNLKKFNTVNERLDLVNKIMNVDSKGLGGSIASIIDTKDAMLEALGMGEKNNTGEPIFGNFENLFTEVASGINAKVPQITLDLLSSGKNPLFFHNAQSVKEIFNTIRLLTGKNNFTKHITNNLFESVKMAAYTTFIRQHLSKKGLDVNQEIIRLLTSRTLENGGKSISLYYRIKNIRSAENYYILEHIGNPSMQDDNQIYHHLAINKSSDPLHYDKVIKSWEDMFKSNNPEIRAIAEDLATYSLLLSPRNYGSFNMITYLPNNYIVKSGLSKFLRDVNSGLFEEDFNSDNLINNMLSNLPEQFIQHNISITKAIKNPSHITKEDIEIVNTNGNIVSKKNVITSIELPNPQDPKNKSNSEVKRLTMDMVVGKDGEGNDLTVKIYPPYLSYYDADKKGKVLLKMRGGISEDTGNVIYDVIDTLGASQFIEYDITRTGKSSFIISNKVSNSNVNTLDSNQVLGQVANLSYEKFKDLNQDEKLVTIEDIIKKISEGVLVENQELSEGISFANIAPSIEKYLFEQIGIISNTQIDSKNKKELLAEYKRMYILVKGLNGASLLQNVKLYIENNPNSNITGQYVREGNYILLNPPFAHTDKNQSRLPKDLFFIRTILHELGEALVSNSSERKLKLAGATDLQIDNIKHNSKILRSIYDEHLDLMKKDLNKYLPFAFLKTIDDVYKINSSTDGAERFRNLLDRFTEEETRYEAIGEMYSIIDKLVDNFTKDGVNIESSKKEFLTFFIRNIIPNIGDINNLYYGSLNYNDFVSEIISNTEYRLMLSELENSLGENMGQLSVEAYSDLLTSFTNITPDEELRLKSAINSLIEVEDDIDLSVFDESFSKLEKSVERLDYDIYKNNLDNFLLSQLDLLEDQIDENTPSFTPELTIPSDLSERTIKTPFELSLEQRNVLSRTIDLLNQSEDAFRDNILVINGESNSGKSTLISLIDKMYKRDNSVGIIPASTNLLGSAKLQLTTRKYSNKRVMNLANYIDENTNLFKGEEFIKNASTYNEEALDIVLLIDDAENLYDVTIDSIKDFATKVNSQKNSTTPYLKVVFFNNVENYKLAKTGSLGNETFFRTENMFHKNLKDFSNNSIIDVTMETGILRDESFVYPDFADMKDMIRRGNNVLDTDINLNISAEDEIIAEELNLTKNQMDNLKGGDLIRLVDRNNGDNTLVTTSKTMSDKLNDTIAYHLNKEGFGEIAKGNPLVFKYPVSDISNPYKEVLPGVIYKIKDFSIKEEFVNIDGENISALYLVLKMENDSIISESKENPNYKNVSSVNVPFLITRQEELNSLNPVIKQGKDGMIIDAEQIEFNKEFIDKINEKFKKGFEEKEDELRKKLEKLKRNSKVISTSNSSAPMKLGYVIPSSEARNMDLNKVIGIFNNENPNNKLGAVSNKTHYLQFVLNVLSSNPDYVGMVKIGEVVGKKSTQTETNKPVETVEQQSSNNQINYYEGDIKPEPNTIFVFGSNPEGKHGDGAAKIAKEQFGAIYGQGEGLQGNAYALPTKDLIKSKNTRWYRPGEKEETEVKEWYKSHSIKEVQNHPLNIERTIHPLTIINSIKKLYEVVKQNPSKNFKVTNYPLGKLSLNGYLGEEMLEMFNQAGPKPSNIVFSKEWVDTNLINPSILEQQSSDNQEGQEVEENNIESNYPLFNEIEQIDSEIFEKFFKENKDLSEFDYLGKTFSNYSIVKSLIGKDITSIRNGKNADKFFSVIEKQLNLLKSEQGGEINVANEIRILKAKNNDKLPDDFYTSTEMNGQNLFSLLFANKQNC